jgi:predicted amidohydrolase
MKDTRVALVISNSPTGRITANLSAMHRWIVAARDRGAKMVCFPELNITGYCNLAEIRRAAIAADGEEVQGLRELAVRQGVTVLAGMAERDDQGRIRASHLVLSADGRQAVYRKVHIAPPEKKVYTAGSRVPLFHLDGLCFGIQLCYDAHFPALSTRMALDGADAIFIPHASPRGTPRNKFRSWMRHLTARAFDNGVFVIAWNQVGENCKGLTFPGVGVVLNPSGEVVAKLLTDREDMLVADLKAEALERVRRHEMRYFLPHRRSDLLTER